MAGARLIELIGRGWVHGQGQPRLLDNAIISATAPSKGARKTLAIYHNGSGKSSKVSPWPWPVLMEQPRSDVRCPPSKYRDNVLRTHSGICSEKCGPRPCSVV